MLAGIDGVSTHFSRFKVTEIALSEQALPKARQQAALDELLRMAKR